MDTNSDHQVGVNAQQADLAEPRFSGWAGGVFVAEYPDLKQVSLYPCPKEEVKAIGNPRDEPILRASSYWFDPPSYLPPGTFDWTYPAGSTCGNDAAFGVHREFLIDGGAEVSIARISHRYLSGNFSQKRVTTGTIAGHEAVIIPPYTQDGYGDCHIVVLEKSGGTIQLAGHDLTLSELTKIAESLVQDLS
ncbi:MAG: hypothetical protein WEB06_10385 [Actinomycetota bacterium]